MRGFVFLLSAALCLENTQSHSFYYAPLHFLTHALQKIKIFTSKMVKLTVLNLKNIQSRGFYHALLYFSAFALLKEKILASKIVGFKKMQLSSFHCMSLFFNTQALRKAKIRTPKGYAALRLKTTQLGHFCDTFGCFLTQIFKNQTIRVAKMTTLTAH